MKLYNAWHALGIFRAGIYSVFAICFIALFGGVFLPISNHFVADILFWFAMSLGLGVAYIWAAHMYRSRLAARKGEAIDVLSTLSDVSYEVLGLLGGGFFGMLFAYVAWNEYREAGGFSGNMLLMVSLAVIGLGAFGVSLVKFFRYSRCESAS